MGGVFREQDQPFSPEPLAHTASEASKVVTPEILDARPLSFVEDLQGKVHRRTPVVGFAPQVRTDKVKSLADRIEHSLSHFYVLKMSGFQVTAFVFLFALISLAVGLTVGRDPLGKHLRDTQKSILAVEATSPAQRNRPGEATSGTSARPAANTFNTPVANPPAPETEESRSESPSAHSLNARPAEAATRVRPTEPSSAVTSRSLMDSDNSSGANKLDEVRPSKAVGPIRGAPRNPAPRRVTPATAAAPHRSPPSAILVRGPGDGSKPFRLTLPEKPIAASSSFAMASQLSVFIAPEPGSRVTHKPARLQPGELVSFVWPRYPRPGDRYETVKVRTTIGTLGQVLDIKLVSGPISLLPAATSAIRLWHYKPTLVNNRPVQAQQEVTIEFLPPQYLSHVTAQHPSHN
jgi:hypothetical protein